MHNFSVYKKQEATMENISDTRQRVLEHDSTRTKDETSEISTKKPVNSVTSMKSHDHSSINEDETSSSGSSEETDDEDNVSSDDREDDQASPPKSSRNRPHPDMVKKSGNTDIHNRLASFFSQLAEQRSQPRMEDEVIEKQSHPDSDSGFEDENDEHGQQYIEIDLAMGVLTEEPKGREIDGIELSSNEDRAETPEMDSDPLQKMTSIGRADGEIRTGEQTEAKKRKIEELG